MSITTLSSRQFNQNTSGAKKATRFGPVIITDRGKPAHVLLTIEQYRQLAGGRMTLLEALAQPGGHKFDFDPPRLHGGLYRAADLR